MDADLLKKLDAVAGLVPELVDLITVIKEWVRKGRTISQIRAVLVAYNLEDLDRLDLDGIVEDVLEDNGLPASEG